MDCVFLFYNDNVSKFLKSFIPATCSIRYELSGPRAPTLVRHVSNFSHCSNDDNVFQELCESSNPSKFYILSSLQKDVSILPIKDSILDAGSIETQ